MYVQKWLCWDRLFQVLEISFMYYFIYSFIQLIFFEQLPYAIYYILGTIERKSRWTRLDFCIKGCSRHCCLLNRPTTCLLSVFSVEMKSLFKGTWVSTSNPIPPPQANTVSCLQIRSSSLELWLSSCNYETTSMKIESQDTEDSGVETGRYCWVVDPTLTAGLQISYFMK